MEPHPLPRGLHAAPGRRFDAHRATIEAAIARVFERGTFILGQEVEGFEAEFAAYLGARHAIGVSSGTEALRLALQALRVGAGDDVVTVSMTFAASALAIEAIGARAVFVDIDPRTRCIDPAALEAAIGPSTAAILPVHLHGHPAPMVEIMRIAQRHGLAVIEDCAQSHGATIDGQCTGTFGHAAAFSFYPTKNLGAAGDAGAVVTSDPQIAERVRRLRNYGQDAARQTIEPGTNGRLDEIQAAILRVLLPHLDRHNEQRRALATEYRARLAAKPVGLPPEHEGAVYHHFAVTLEGRHAVQARLHEKHGIGTGVHYSPAVHQHPHFARDGLALPHTERLARETLSLPIQPEVAEGHVAHICDALLESVIACRS